MSRTHCPRSARCKIARKKAFMLRTSRATQATQKPVNLEHVVSQKSRLRNYDALLRFVLRRQDCPEENLEEIAMAGGSGQMLWLATTRSPHGVTGRIGGLAKELYAKGGWHFRQSESGLPENVSRVSARRAQHRGKRTCRVSSRALSANFPEGDSLRPAQHQRGARVARESTHLPRSGCSGERWW